MGKLRYWFKDTGLYRHFLSAVLHPKTFLFLKKYPFWKCKNVWNGRFLGWDCSSYDWISKGWRKAFGKELTNDIVKALEEDNIPRGKWEEHLQWEDIKEKYGSLRLYAATTKKVQDVLDKYECLSIGYCENCGKPARYVTSGWISYVCEDCYANGYAKYGDHGYRLTEQDIPIYYTFKGDEEIPHTPMEKWGIDFKEIWGIGK